MAMRAVSKDFETAKLMGININRVISVTFAIGSFLAGVGSILYFTDRMSVTPFSGTLPGSSASLPPYSGNREHPRLP
jgi:branched-chain amino acid transport system permease protein